MMPIQRFPALAFTLLILFFTSLITPSLAQQAVHSPNQINSVIFDLKDGEPTYSVQRFGQTVIEPSKLGFTFRDQPAMLNSFSIQNLQTETVDKTWEQVWGEKQFIKNHYNELRVELIEEAEPARQLTVVFRVYDDGIGFRYEIPEQDGIDEIYIMDEHTEFNLTGDHLAWYIDAYQWNRYEYLTKETPVTELDTVHTPLTMRSDDGLYMSIHQAALTDYSTMTLERLEGTKLKANLVPWADGVLVRTHAPMKTPWRTIQLSDTPGGLITSYLILNLNEPNKIEDTSWIKPAKYVGIWWGMHLDKYTWGPGDKLGATTDRAKRYIDFAADHGFDHVLVEGWNPGWDEEWYESGVVFDFTESTKFFDLEKVAAYALDNGVRLMGHHETSASVEHYEGQMEEAFALYEELGVRSVKTGYVGHGQEIYWTNEEGEKQYEWHHGQHMVEHHQRVVELAAKHRISLNVHEGVMDTGLRRTWPNLMTREVARGQEYNAWGGGDDVWDGTSNPPNHATTIPFTRNLAGPFDYTPGVVELFFDQYRPDNRINHTLTKELALYVIVYSPLQMAADLPEHYEQFPGPFQFIRDVPADWQDTRVLHGDVGNYVTIARKERNSDEWYLGSITDEHGRLLETPLSFLDAGTTYVAEIYRDGLEADWITDPYSFEIEQKLVTSQTVMNLRLAAGGGQAVRFRPASEGDLERFEHYE